MFDWLRRHVWWVTTFSIVFFVIGLVVAAIFVIRMPADYFVRTSAPAPDRRHAAVRVARRIVKNLLAIVLLIAGVLLSLPLVPGPGLLVILIAVSLADFPGKRDLELRIVKNPFVLHPINRLRAIGRRRPLQMPPG